MSVIVIRKSFRNHRVEIGDFDPASPSLAAAPLASYKAPHQAVALSNWIVLTRQQSRSAQRGAAFSTSRLGRLALAA